MPLDPGHVLIAQFEHMTSRLDLSCLCLPRPGGRRVPFAQDVDWHEIRQLFREHREMTSRPHVPATPPIGGASMGDGPRTHRRAKRNAT
jgi:hypothetical protein